MLLLQYYSIFFFIFLLLHQNISVFALQPWEFLSPWFVLLVAGDCWAIWCNTLNLISDIESRKHACNLLWLARHGRLCYPCPVCDLCVSLCCDVAWDETARMLVCIYQTFRHRGESFVQEWWCPCVRPCGSCNSPWHTHTPRLVDDSISVLESYSKTILYIQVAANMIIH